MTKVKVIVTYSPEVGGASVLSLKQSFLSLGSEVIDGDYRQMMREIPKEEFMNLYATVAGREILFAHAKAKATALLRDVDVLALSGSNSMIDPELFVQDREAGVHYDFSRTIAELALVHVATEKGMPIIGICGGHQVLAVYGGGEISSLTSEKLDKQKFMNYDAVKLYADSMLAKIITGNLTTKKNNKLITKFHKLLETLAALERLHSMKLGSLSTISAEDEIVLSGLIKSITTITSKKVIAKIVHIKKQLSSIRIKLQALNETSDHAYIYEFFGAHNQVVSRLGQGFKQTGVASDGESIESVESEYGSPIIGTQFHPEVGAQGLPGSSFIYTRSSDDIARNLAILKFINEAGETYQRKKSLLLQIKQLKVDKVIHERSIDIMPIIKPSDLRPIQQPLPGLRKNNKSQQFFLMRVWFVCLIFKFIISPFIFICQAIYELCRVTLGDILRNIMSKSLTSKKVSSLRKKEKDRSAAKELAVQLENIEVEDKVKIEQIEATDDVLVSSKQSVMRVQAPCFILRDTPLRLWQSVEEGACGVDKSGMDAHPIDASDFLVASATLSHK